MNITKKRLLKIKNTKNQSRKKLYPKYKKKYKKNKSFRRRRKHNLQNKSLKKYKKLIKRKRKKKANKKGGNKIVIGKEIILNQLAPKSADADADDAEADGNSFILMPGRYSPITKTILLGDENISVKYINKTIDELFIAANNEDGNWWERDVFGKSIKKLKRSIEQLSLKETKVSYKEINKIIDNYEKITKFRIKMGKERRLTYDGKEWSRIPKEIKEFPTEIKNIWDKMEKKVVRGSKEGKLITDLEEDAPEISDEIINLLDWDKMKKDIKMPLNDFWNDFVGDGENWRISINNKIKLLPFNRYRFIYESDGIWDVVRKQVTNEIDDEINTKKGVIKVNDDKYKDGKNKLGKFQWNMKKPYEEKKIKTLEKQKEKLGTLLKFYENYKKWMEFSKAAAFLMIKEIRKKFKSLIEKDADEKLIVENGEWLETQVTIQYQETKPANMLPLWKYINSIALLTQSDIVSNDKDNKDNINVNNFEKFKKSIDEIIKNDKTGDFNKQIVFYHYPTDGLNGRKCLPLFNWREDNNIFKSHHEKELINIKNILQELETSQSSSGRGQSGGNTPDSVINLNNFIKKVTEARQEQEKNSSKAEDNLYQKFIDNAGNMKNQLQFIEYNKRLFEKEKDKIIGKLHNLDAEKKKLENFDSQQEKNNLVKLFVNIREKLMNNLLEDASPEKRAEIQMKFQKFKKGKQKETDAIDAQLKISQGKEAATSVPKTPGSFSMGNHFNAIANDKYPNDQYIVPESLDPWGITIDPEKNGLFARFNIRQHPYQFDKDNEVINEFNLVDTPEWLQFVGDSLEDRRGITPAYKPPEGTVSGVTTDEAIEGQKDEVKALERKSKKLKEGKISRLDRGKQMLKGNLYKKSALKGQQKEVEKEKGQAETLLKVKQDTRKADDKKEADEAAKKKEEDIKEKAKDEIKEEEKEKKKEEDIKEKAKDEIKEEEKE